MWRIEYIDLALSELQALGVRLQFSIAKKIVALATNPFPRGHVKMAGQEGLYRIRCGDFRVVYHVERSRRVVTIARIRRRKDVYRNL